MQKNSKKNKTINSKRGFSLIEMLVATALFSAVMLIGVGSLLALIDANKKAQALNSVMNNLNFAIESMSRKMRVGTTYHCEFSNNIPPPNINQSKDCTGGGKLLAFEPSGGTPDDSSDQIVYRINGTRIEKSESGGTPGSFINITASEVTIDDLSFYVDGTSSSDNLQPRIVMIISGSAGVKEKIKTEFNLQTMVSQRVLDI
ncbi:MAG: type II secretion system protein [Parcubacteria group bacterium]|nr:type II secretion system protein [Parcubacteria group bacterium]